MDCCILCGRLKIKHLEASFFHSWLTVGADCSRAEEESSWLRDQPVLYSNITLATTIMMNSFEMFGKTHKQRSYT